MFFKEGENVVSEFAVCVLEFRMSQTYLRIASSLGYGLQPASQRGFRVLASPDSSGQLMLAERE
jgi:hypothetical protein